MRVTLFDAFRSLAVVFLVISGPAHAWQSPAPASAQPTLRAGPGSAPGPGPEMDTSPAGRQVADRMAARRNVDRQQRIVDDTAKLLALAQELKDEVAKSNRNELSLGVVHKAEEIEKLAKSVKERMRDGQ